MAWPQDAVKETIRKKYLGNIALLQLLKSSLKNFDCRYEDFRLSHTKKCLSMSIRSTDRVSLTKANYVGRGVLTVESRDTVPLKF